ncbi:alpha/beta hydrolase [Microbacterium stercoris]|uniref:Alpha/beta hydrolase n=1 Tax=Microbacterium stercoris TaxID=2820289 RepID=A0A939QKH3_9MICO|nr:alpha/beta hydrolase [Microbacterium stercoris]MBO3663815.1 alpha/beta hydrolase [Microbacterium stercoris]
MKRWRRIVLWIVGVVAVLAVAGVVFWNVSPWPGVWLLRSAPDPAGLSNAETAGKYVPADIHADLDLVYDDSSAEGRLDVFRPEDADESLPTVLWVHGGAFIAGQKEPLRNYLQVLASHGFTVVNIEYTHAPEATYPTPIRQVDRAIEYVVAHAEELGADPERLVLAGDSAGAHIAAQSAMAIAQPDYAEAAELSTSIRPDQLRGVVLFSGPYDPTTVDYDNDTFGFFMRTVMWSYSGTKSFLEDEKFRYTALPQHVDADYPPTLVSTGPADPLLKQNLEWVDALDGAGVDVTELFFDPATTPDTVGHEYQLALDTPQAKQALIAQVAFVRDVTRAEMRAGVSDGWR